jgi:hypothetical protein
MHTEKPEVICHMMATIDGKITSGLGIDILEDYFELYTETENQLQGDSWMCGRITAEMFATGQAVELLPLIAQEQEIDYTEVRSEHGYMITIDTKGTLRWAKNRVKLSN